MVGAEDLAVLANTISAVVVAKAQDALGLTPGADPTPDEADAFVSTLMMVSAGLAAFLMQSMPPDKAANVPAFIQKFTGQIMAAVQNRPKIILAPGTDGDKIG